MIGSSSTGLWLTEISSERSTIICYVYLAESRCFQHVTHSRNPSESDSRLWTKNEIHFGLPSLSDLESHLPYLTSERLAEYPDSHLLFFRTTSAYFTTCCNKTSVPVSFVGHDSSTLPLVLDPRDGDKVVGILSRVPADQISTEPSTAEFIKIGLRSDANLPPEIMPPKVLVLQIERDEDGVARRLNYGEIELGAWEAAEPQECLVALG
jgi:hypothetical protein